MVIQDFEMVSLGEVESLLQVEDQPPSLGRESSIYALTFNELQNTLCEDGRDLGSMNIDEFLASIWNVEENLTVNTSDSPPIINENYSNNGNTILVDENDNNNNFGNTLIVSENNNNSNGNTIFINENNNNNGNTIAQMGMHSLSQAPARYSGTASRPLVAIPANLCRRTVHEVWAELQRGHQQNGSPGVIVNVPDPNQSVVEEQALGEITLEEFLVKVGICRESLRPPQHQIPPPQPQPQQYGMYPNSNINVGANFVGTTMMGIPGGIIGGVGVSALQGMAPPHGVDGHGNGGVFFPQQLAVAYGERVDLGEAIGIPAPIIPNGMCVATSIHASAGLYGMERRSLRGRRRITECPMERVAERRHRRMIKNRESAARSRARKQAYTIELEAELEKLREENSQLKQAKFQQRVDEVKMKAHVKAESSKEKLAALRRTSSCSM